VTIQFLISAKKLHLSINETIDQLAKLGIEAPIEFEDYQKSHVGSVSISHPFDFSQTRPDFPIIFKYLTPLYSPRLLGYKTYRPIPNALRKNFPSHLQISLSV